jgi:hypothetical protein
MKILTIKELLDAPNTVQHIYISAMTGNPVGSSVCEEAIDKHPEYFLDIIERRKRWAAIPQKVHDNYWEAYRNLDNEILKNVPESKGIIYWADNPNEYVKWNNEYTKAKEQGRLLYENLHKKFYSKYGF